MRRPQLLLSINPNFSTTMRWCFLKFSGPFLQLEFGLSYFLKFSSPLLRIIITTFCGIILTTICRNWCGNGSLNVNVLPSSLNVLPCSPQSSSKKLLSSRLLQEQPLWTLEWALQHKFSQNLICPFFTPLLEELTLHNLCAIQVGQACTQLFGPDCQFGDDQILLSPAINRS